MTAKGVKFFFSPEYGADIGAHVFATGKFAEVAELMRPQGELIAPGMPSAEDLALAHEPLWVSKVINDAMTLEDSTLMELPFSPAVSRAHQLQVSGTILACRDALENGVGLHIGGGSHHAFPDHGEGFCVLNDIACGIIKMRVERRLSRAAVVDLDVHQGNGTAAIFRGDPDVFTFSMHQENIYPPIKPPSSLDVGLPEGMGDAAYLSLLENNLPAVFESHPELVVYQAGVDCAAGDLIGGLKLTKEGLGRRDELVFKACWDHRVPVAVTLGGGYSGSIKETAALHAQTLMTGIAFRNFLK